MDADGRGAAGVLFGGGRRRGVLIGWGLILLALAGLAGCGGSVYGRSGAGGGVGGSVPAVVWAGPE